MVITKQELQEWNSHPVTKVIFAQVKEQLNELRAESTLRSTVDETAMATAKNEGIAEGALSLFEAYELQAENAE